MPCLAHLLTHFACTSQPHANTFCLVEGYGEAVFELGYENNGDSMQLTADEWQPAYDRLVAAAKKLNADCELLITKYVGGDKEAESTKRKTPKAGSGCSGKVLVRSVPSLPEDVIETRIAVVGNGKLHLRVCEGRVQTDKIGSRCWQELPSRCISQGRSRRWERQGTRESLQTQA